jgi:bacteriocin-like protein
MRRGPVAAPVRDLDFFLATGLGEARRDAEPPSSFARCSQTFASNDQEMTMGDAKKAKKPQTPSAAGPGAKPKDQEELSDKDLKNVSGGTAKPHFGDGSV